ncbi:mannose-6-phosphate receptor family member [Anaeramoeba ignava]|uniref:Mannose-6-phosphate receptor family member n=1 Tax=Anaeramoeba ignava TaxID=1746090 RepID=A0A9Q0LU11_ANAIG|nr:mannose-6-phosphate receptor family member [Anaeramoeba ignava]
MLLTFLEFIFLIGFLCIITQTQTPVGCDFALKDENQNQHYYNFTSLMRKDYQDPYTYQDLDANYFYMLNLCANIENILDCPCCTPGTSTGYVIEETNQSTSCTSMGHTENILFGALDKDDLEDGIYITYFLTYDEFSIERYMTVNLYCNNYQSFKLVTVFYENDIRPNGIQVNILTNLACFEKSNPVSKLNSCSKCSAPAATFGVFSSLFFGILVGYMFYKWKQEKQSI